MVNMKQQYVLISGQYKRLKKRLTELNIPVNKTQGSHLYFEVESDLSALETIRQVKIKIYEDKEMWELVYQIFPVVDGIIDFLPYMDQDTKQTKYKYYQNK